MLFAEMEKLGEGGEQNQAVSVWAPLNLRCLLDTRRDVKQAVRCRGVARQEMKMWAPPARGGILIQDTG